MTKRTFYIVSYAGDMFAGLTLTEAFDAACLESRHTGYWATIEASDAGAARLKLGANLSPWVEFTTDRGGRVIGGNR